MVLPSYGCVHMWMGNVMTMHIFRMRGVTKFSSTEIYRSLKAREGEIGMGGGGGGNTTMM